MASAEKTTSRSDGQQTPAAPSISLPKGGGTISGIGEKYVANPVTGTSSLSIPLATSPGRSGSARSLRCPTIPARATALRIRLESLPPRDHQKTRQGAAPVPGRRGVGGAHLGVTSASDLPHYPRPGSIDSPPGDAFLRNL